jgi:2-iminobutanoate/2-iminopropanoate deaminase
MNQQRWRQSFEIPGASHGTTPIPTGTRVGNVLFSSGIMGADPTTGKLSADADEQVRLAFLHMDSLLAAAGSSLGDVARVSVSVNDLSTREIVNREWLARFPDSDDRPSRHTDVKSLRGGMLVQLEIIAVLR